ncbi:hypothetical protein [Herbaspirillum sp. 1130]|uniref:hypothetical protein n=1 Tax=Herbaspirillum sp. 1130 TaxID=2806562 RepID=UPI001AE33BCE|nr:hypothetical protein [Herbaspirillum sp. 1130]MBP1316318.1 hypothetical protein [Herbaspirillum sp. 1130]
MKAERYLVLVHLAAKPTRKHLTDVAIQLGATIKSNLRQCEAVCLTATSLAFVGESPLSADSLFRQMAAGLHSGDNLSVLALGNEFATTHPGLYAWARLRSAQEHRMPTPARSPANPQDATRAE